MKKTAGLGKRRLIRAGVRSVGPADPRDPLSDSFVSEDGAAARHRVFGGAVHADRAGTLWPASESSLSVASIYEDAGTWTWVSEVNHSIARTLGKDAVQSDGWNISDFAKTGVLAEAVSAASRADVIIAALNAVDELPWEFCVWVDAWLPRRPQTTGALIGLVGVSEASPAQCFRTEDYLSAVARRGDLEFFVRWCDLPSLASPAVNVAATGVTAAADDSYPHWGLNE